jgi:hypothetical protein
VRRTFIVAGLTTLTLNLASFGTGAMPLRPDTSRSALTTLGQEYEDLQTWATEIAITTDTLASAERTRVLAGQLAHLMEPLQGDFEKTTAALTTSQLEIILPLWERMAFAHAGFAMLAERASALGKDAGADPLELHDIAAQLSAVLDFASEIQRRALGELITPVPTPIRLT